MMKCGFFRTFGLRGFALRPFWVMPRALPPALSKREQQAMDILFRVGEATAADIQQELPDEPGYSAVRALLKVLVDKGLASVEKPEGMRQLVYRPAVPVRQARKSAIKRMLSTFFSGSPSELVANLLDPTEGMVSEEERARIRQLIDARSKKGGGA